jgi:hypothetical protein
MMRAMVLVFQPELTHSVWIDYWSKARTMTGLIKDLQRGVKDGRFVAYRLIHVYVEITGVVHEPTGADFAKPRQHFN